jgi:hypothetical protein
MEIDVIGIVVICVLAGLGLWANDKLNTVPVLKTVVQVVIVVVAVILLLQSLGVMGHSNMHILVK